MARKTTKKTTKSKAASKQGTGKPKKKADGAKAGSKKKPAPGADAQSTAAGKKTRKAPAVKKNNSDTVAAEVAAQIAAGSHEIVGVMLESHLVGGRQDLVAGRALTYGQSITDACLAWEDTLPVLRVLARAVRARRRGCRRPARA